MVPRWRKGALTHNQIATNRPMATSPHVRVKLEHGPPASLSGRTSASRSKTAKSAQRVGSYGKQKSDACGWCRRQWTIENPLKKHRLKCPTLPHSKGYGPCDVCRAAKRYGSVQTPDTVLTDDCKDDDKQANWMVIVHSYEAVNNGEDPQTIVHHPLPGPPQQEDACSPATANSVERQGRITLTGRPTTP